jgi:hypothetical protein
MQRAINRLRGRHMAHRFLPHFRQDVFVVILLGVTVLAACGERSNPVAPTAAGDSVAASAAQAAQSSNVRGIQLHKGSEVVLESLDGSPHWNFVIITTTLKGQHGFRVEARGTATSYSAAFPCLDIGCAPGTPLPLRLFLHASNVIGEARLQGRTFEVGGAMGGYGDVGLVALTFDGMGRTPLSTTGSETLSFPVTVEGQLLYPSGELAPNEAPLTGTAHAILTFEWQQFPLAQSEGWMITAARYVFD